MTGHTSRPALFERRFPGRRCPLSGKPLCFKSAYLSCRCCAGSAVSTVPAVTSDNDFRISRRQEKAEFNDDRCYCISAFPLPPVPSVQPSMVQPLTTSPVFFIVMVKV